MTDREQWVDVSTGQEIVMYRCTKHNVEYSELEVGCDVCLYGDDILVKKPTWWDKMKKEFVDGARQGMDCKEDESIKEAFERSQQEAWQKGVHMRTRVRLSRKKLTWRDRVLEWTGVICTFTLFVLWMHSCL